MFIYLNSIS